ncbi:MAG: ATP synthase F1 subunit delta [Candidatus Cloacimonetes bacterium]|nr:ATP synthase F1 subunit delta [Candidatus Cloacimonadota bacterium]
MKGILAAKRYSQAIITDLDEKEIHSILSDVEILQSTLAKYPEILSILNSHLYTHDLRLEIVHEMSKNLKNSKLWENLFSILLKKHRFIILNLILQDMEKNILHIKNQIKIDMTIAHELSKKMLDSISKKIEDIVKKDVILNIKIDPDILGGFVARTDSMVIDGSIKNNLVKLLNVKSIKQ